jgi:Homeodomain-like domain
MSRRSAIALPARIAQRAERPQKHVWRARVVLLTAEGVGTRAIMRETSKSKTCVWRWQERFADEALKGCCATRRGLRASRSLIRCRRTRRDADDGAAAGRSHALDGRSSDGGGSRRQRLFRATHLTLPRTSAIPHPAVQALQRPRVRRQVARRGRASPSNGSLTPKKSSKPSDEGTKR